MAFLQKTDFSDNPETAAIRAPDSHVTDIVEEKYPLSDEDIRRRGRRTWLRLSAGLGIAALAGLVVAVAIRTQVAEIIAKDIVQRRAGAPLTLSVAALGAGGGVIRDITLGAPGGPGLRIDRADLRWRIDAVSGLVDVTRLELTGVELRAAVRADGTLDLGPIGPFLSPAEGPKRLRLNGLGAEDVVVRLATPQGAATARVDASGGETTGWRIAARDMTLPPALRTSATSADAGRLEATLQGRQAGAVWTADDVSVALGDVAVRGVSGQVRLSADLGNGTMPVSLRLLPSRLSIADAAAPGLAATSLEATLRSGGLILPKTGLAGARLDLDARMAAGRIAAGAVRLRGAGLDVEVTRAPDGAVAGAGVVFAAQGGGPDGAFRNLRIEAAPGADLKLGQPNDPATLTGSLGWRLEADRAAPSPTLLQSARSSLASAGGAEVASGHLRSLDATLAHLGAEGLALSAGGAITFKGLQEIRVTVADGASAAGAGVAVRMRAADGAQVVMFRRTPEGLVGTAAGALSLTGPDGLTGRLTLSQARLSDAGLDADGALRIGPWSVGGRTATLEVDRFAASLRNGLWRISAAGGARWVGPDLDATVSGAQASLTTGRGGALRGSAAADVRFRTAGAAGATRIEAAIGAGRTRLGRFALATPFGEVSGDGVVLSSSAAGSVARTAGCLNVRPAAAAARGARFEGPVRLCPDAGGLRFGPAGGEVSGWVETPATRVGPDDAAARIAPARLRVQTSWRGTGRDMTAVAQVSAAGLAIAAQDGALQGLEARASGLEARIEASGAQWRAAGAVTGADAAVAGVRLTGGGAFAAEGSAEGVGAEVTGLDLIMTDGAAAPRFAPLRAAGSLMAGGGLVDGALEVSLVSNGTRLGTVDILHDLTAGAGGARFAADRIAFSRRGLQPDAIAPLLEGLVANADGVVEATAEALWSPGAPLITTGRLASAGIDFATGVGPFERVSGAVELTDLLAVRSAPGQTVRVGRFNPGLPIDDGEVSFSLPGGARIALDSARWPFAGGTLALKPDEWVIGAPRQDLAVDVIGVDLGRFLELARIPDLTVTGAVNGRFPIVVENTIARIEGGRLIAEGAGGTISYKGPAAEVASQNSGAKLAFDALANLRYRVLEIGVDGPLTGDLSLKFLFEGANPDVMSGYPIRFNLGATGPFVQLARALGSLGARGQAIGEQVRDEIERQQRGSAPAPVPGATAPVPAP